MCRVYWSLGAVQRADRIENSEISATLSSGSRNRLFSRDEKINGWMDSGALSVPTQGWTILLWKYLGEVTLKLIILICDAITAVSLSYSVACGRD